MQLVCTKQRTAGRRALVSAFEALIDGLTAVARVRISEAREFDGTLAVEADVLEGLVLRAEGFEDAAQAQLEQAGWRAVVEGRLRSTAS